MMISPPAPPQGARRRESAPAARRRPGPVVMLPPPPDSTAPRWVLPLSIAVHVVAVALLVLFLRVGSPVLPSPPAPAGERVEYIDLAFPGPGTSSAPPSTAPAAGPSAAPIAPGAVVRPRSREEERLVFPRGAAPSGIPAPRGGETGGAPGAGAAGGAGAQGGGGGGGGVGDRLRPGFADSRLYVDQDAEALKRTDTRSDQEKYMAHLRARIEASNDSAWAAGSHPNTDWTTEDGKGRKWGVDEKGLHLGGITIPKQILPLPPSTGTNQKQEEGRKAQREREEIQRQEEARERRKGQKEAIEATRRRKDEERAKERGGG